jgi:hypothetical protein
MKKRHLLMSLAIGGILGASAIAFSFSYSRSAKPKMQPIGSAHALPLQDEARRFSDTYRVRATALSSQSRGFLSNLGDRLEKAGKERITYSGTLQRSGDASTTPFALTWELPGRIRLEDFGRQQVTTFDGENVSRTPSALTSWNDELLETLVYDSAEHLFVSQTQGAATRFLGSRFQLASVEGDRNTSVYDIIEVTETNKVRPNSDPQVRHYLFNSDSQVLELVKYQLMRNGTQVPVEIHLEGWHRIGAQLFPSRIVRLESGATVLTLTIATATITPRLDDGIFLTGRAT